MIGPASACPTCGRVNDATTRAAAGRPDPRRGDVSVCLYCAGVAIFTGHALDVRPLEPGETHAVLSDPNVRAARAAAAVARRRMGR
jgi:hypothetical protein